MNQTSNSIINRHRVGTRRYRSRLTVLSGRPDFTAMVDLMFLMLVFFLLSSSFVQVSGIKVDLPRAGATTTTDIEKFIVSAAWNGEGNYLLYFNDSPVDIETLKEKLAEISGISKSATVVLRIDNRIPFQVVAQLMTLAEKADLATFIAVLPQENTPEAIFTQQ